MSSRNPPESALSLPKPFVPAQRCKRLRMPAEFIKRHTDGRICLVEYPRVPGLPPVIHAKVIRTGTVSTVAVVLFKYGYYAIFPSRRILSPCRTDYHDIARGTNE